MYFWHETMFCIHRRVRCKNVAKKCSWNAFFVRESTLPALASTGRFLAETHSGGLWAENSFGRLQESRNSAYRLTLPSRIRCAPRRRLNRPFTHGARIFRILPPPSDSRAGCWGATPILGSWGVWVPMVSRRGIKAAKLNVDASVTWLVHLRCCQARTQLQNAHKIMP